VTTQTIDVDALADRFFDGVLQREPVSATRIGDHRWDDRLSDYGDGGRAADAAACREVLAAADAIAPQPTGEQAITLEVLTLVARNRLELLDQNQYQLAIDHIFGVQTLPAEIAMFQPAEQPDQLDALLARFSAYPRAIDEHIATLREGMGDGRTSAAVPVRKTIGQIERMLANPPAAFTAVKLAQVASSAARDRVRETVEAHIYPALQNLRDFLADEYAPAARLEPSMAATPNGEAAYELAVRLQTTTLATAEEVHELGLSEVEQIEAEMDELARSLGYSDRQPLRRQLFEDPANLPVSRQQPLDLATGRLRQAAAAAPTFFRRLPRTACDVNPIERDREDLDQTHYWPPAADGARPGLFRLNTKPGPSGLPLHMLPALTFHEAIPGHHFQLAIEVELSGLPRFRTQIPSIKESPGLPPLIGTGFGEGWGLYAERLADEMGLYATENARMGMLEWQLWRALRLVLDSGLHARRWSREQAVGYAQERLGAPREFCEMEVDRYSVWPAQALAYKVGQREIERARREVARHMGDRFDLGVFHDQVLGHGTLPLTIFQREIAGWVEAAI